MIHGVRYILEKEKICGDFLEYLKLKRNYFELS